MHRSAERAHAGGPKVPDVCGAGTAHWFVLGKRFPSRGCVSLVPRGKPGGDIGFIVQTSLELLRKRNQRRLMRLTHAIDDAEVAMHRDHWTRGQAVR